ncbi:MAG: DUF115 domain-containing protein [Phycisphaerae bacterium]|nr:DUF115 domain-containing protein [Phycisphaerae bacterium]
MAPHVASCETFVRNMTALYRRDPRLAHAVEHCSDDAQPSVEPSRSGPPTASVQSPDGRRLYLHSRHDPLAEARTFCDALGGDDAMVTVLCGLGLGHHVPPLLDATGGEGVVIVSEPNVGTIRAALEQTELHEAIAEQHLIFLTSADKGELHDKLTPLGAMLMLGARFAVPPAARTLHADFHAAIRQAINDFAAFSRMSLLTLVANSRITCENIAGNLPAYLATPTIDVLRDAARGWPAIVVSAGPSLARNIDRLREAAGRAVIIAVQTTLKPLRAVGITPDFATTLDFSDLSKRFFEGIDDFGDAVLVAEPKASPAILDMFRGRRGPRARPVLLLNNDFAHRCVGAELAARSGLRAGSTVAHLSLYLAEHLGCDPIIFVGQDLGFSGHVYYTPGVTIHDAWQAELDRFCSLEQKEWERIARHRPILRRMTDVHGRPIYTDEQMCTYLEQFERDFAGASAEIIDATEGGVRKAGARSMTLREVIERYCTRPLPESLTAARRAARAYHAERLEAGRRAIVERRTELEDFRRLCEQTRDVLRQLAGCLDDPPRFNQLIIRVDELRTRVRRHDRVFRMVCDVSQLAELQKYSADRRLAASGAKGRERSARQLERDRRFIDALLAACADLERIRAHAQQRFDAEIASASEPSEAAR